MADLDRGKVQGAIDTHDALGLSQAAEPEQLARIKTAEEVIGLVLGRKKEVSWLSTAPQLLVSVVAVAGMLVNAYQSYENKQQAQRQSQVDQERWSKEFVRAQRADKYRAFFETSVLATDPTNADKRLVGYALMQEFVDDEDYNSKATLMLEEALAQELRADAAGKGDEESHRNAVVAIISALSESNDCHALERAARSIDQLARHATQADHQEEVAELFKIYVRKLMGHAAIACRTMKDYSSVRRPLMETMVRQPGIAGMTGKPKPTEASTRLAQLLAETCHEEVLITGVSECPQIFQHYLKLCADEKKPSDNEAAACAELKKDEDSFGTPTPSP